MQYRDVWSVRLGRFGDVQVRLHMFFALFAAFTFYLAWLEADRTHDLREIAIMCIVVLFISVLIHELGHFFMASRLGADVDSIVLGPLGGLRSVRIPHDPQSELLVAVSGITASFACCLVCLLSLTLAGETDSVGLLNPLAPERLIDPTTHSIWSITTVLKIGCWINWVLVLVNLIPAFPFDGACAAQAFLRTMRPEMDARKAVSYVATCAKFVAIGLLFAAWYYHDLDSTTAVPVWLALVLLSIFVFFSTRIEEVHSPAQDEEEDFFGYDFSQGFTSLEKAHIPEPKKEPGLFGRWLKARREKSAAEKREKELTEDRRLDEILARLHSDGEDALSSEERSLLKRVSARYRNRQHIQ